jgi:hypothetical protein
MYRHLSSFGGIVGVADTLVNDLVDAVTPPVVGTLLSILSVDQVFRLKGGWWAQDACALAEGCHIKWDFALRLRKDKYLAP